MFVLVRERMKEIYALERPETSLTSRWSPMMISVKSFLSFAVDLATSTRKVHQTTAGITPILVNSGDRGFAGSECGRGRS